MAITMKNVPAENVAAYIAGFPKNVQIMLKQMRAVIKKAAPSAEETIKYAIPTFTLHGNLISFAAFKNHIGLYPAPRNVEPFKKELSNYKGAKSTVQFPLDKPLPLGLISRIVKFQVKRNQAIAKAK